MSLLVDLRVVPDRIFQVVKERIASNRAKLQGQQQVSQLKGATRPRVQRPRFGATQTTYRPPEPAAVGKTGQKILLGPKSAPEIYQTTNPFIAPNPAALTGNGTRYITGDGWTYNQFAFTSHRAKGVLYQVLSFKENHFRLQYNLVNGSYVRTDVFTGSIEQTVAFAAAGGPNGANALVVTQSQTNQSTSYIDSKSISADAYYPAYSSLNAVKGAAVTSEFYAKISGVNKYDLSINFSNASVYIPEAASVTGYEPYMYFGSAPYSFNVYLPDFAEWTHVAIVCGNQSVKLFIDGKLLVNAPTADKIFTQSAPRLVLGGLNMTRMLQLSISSLRIVDRALYRSDFTPPAAIR